MPESDPSLQERLREEILFAREQVYRFDHSTPLERLIIPGIAPEIWVKREDLSAIKSYKWRGACNRVANLTTAEAQIGIVTASAGNHAQGVALAAAKRGIHATIFMPRTTPRVKQDAVRHHGGAFVTIQLVGDSYDDAVKAAKSESASSGATYIHAYDDLQVMAGQGTLADEIILSGQGPFDAAFLQIGGGGMAAGVSTWLKKYWPSMEIIGVEGVHQASMKASLEAGKILELEQVDLFCDGTAVKKPGDLPFAICQTNLSRIVTVSNHEVSQAIRILWEGLRCIAEPSGAMGLAAALQEREVWVGKKILVVLCGANIDFLQLGHVAQSLGGLSLATKTLQINIPDRPGAMLSLLDTCFAGLNIEDFQYGKCSETQAWPVFRISAASLQSLEAVTDRLLASGYRWNELSEAVDINYRAIPLKAELLSNPLFLRLDFYERAGALHTFLDQRIRGKASICYFNYQQTGERIGRAMIGLDFPSPEELESWTKNMPKQGEGFRLCQPLDEATRNRILGRF